MNRKPAIEGILKGFVIQPGPRVKRAVLARYAERHGRGHRPDAGAAELWRRPVPLYAAAAIALAVAAIAFIGGRNLSSPMSAAPSESSAAQDSLANAAINQSWRFAPRDVL